MAGKIIVPILSAFSAKGVNDAKSSLGGLKSALGDIGKQVGAGITGGGAAISAGKFLEDAITQARDLQRNMMAVNTIFDEQAAKMKSFISTSQGMGLSSADAAKATVFLGSVLKQSGFSMDEVATQTQRLTSLGADLAMIYGYDVQEALTGMTAMFRGEYDPIEKFGVAIKQAQVNALVAAKGLSHLTGVEKLHAQQVAKLELFYAAVADAEGAFARQTDSLFAQQSMLTAGFQNLQAALGDPLIAPLAHMAAMFRSTLGDLSKGLMPVFVQFGKILDKLAPVARVLGEVFAALGPSFELVFGIIADAIDVVMPIFLGLWQALKPIINAVNAVLKVIGTIVKALMIPIKMLAIVIGVLLNSLGGLFEFFGGALTDSFGGIGQMFGIMNGDLDTMNNTLDDIIANVYKLDTAVSGAGVNTTTLAGILAASGPGKTTKPGATLTDEQKKFIESVKKFKTEMTDVLKSAMPGALATRELGDFEKAVVDSFRSIFDKISQGVADKILSSGAAKALRNYATAVKTELQQIASERDKLARKLDLGKALIADTKKAVIGFASLSNLMSDVNSNITKSVTYMVGKFTVTTSETIQAVANAETIINKFRDIVGKTRDFAANLTKLKAMNISGELYNQILAGGLEQGAAVADALVTGGQNAVDELNGLFGELSTAGAGMGEQAAQVMYGAGVDLSDGLIAGLLSADEKLKAAAETLATSFRNAFSAGISGTGVTGGFSAPNVSGLYAENAIAASTYTPSSATNINITVNAGIGTDGATVGKAIVDSIKKYERTSGKVFARAV